MITIRKATKADAELIARGFLTAMWVEADEAERMLPMCIALAEMDNSLYSWRHSHIAQWDGVDAGVLIAYDGAVYHDAAQLTFSFVKEQSGKDFTNMTEEAEPGEWYIDTLAVFPHFRRKGIAKVLLQKGIALSRECPATRCATLYVDPEHPWVVKLYDSVGFKPDGEAFIFGQNYLKMKC
ncbi:MAG: GNAT family N-acetyltransferase [Prevotella sp.]